MNNAYAQSGVDIAAGSRATELMASAVRATYGKEVLAGLGAFGGLYDASVLKAMDAPVLVASTDGVGTKTKVAARLNRWDTIGSDLVNHCINDIVVQGARPLFFLDYIAASKLEPEQIAAVVRGVAEACRAAGIALLGGETAEMPGVYEPGEIDLAGTIIGVVDRARIIDGSQIRTGDVILSLPASGLHTNGFSLARRALDGLDWNASHPALDGTIGDALLAVHRCYLDPVEQVRNAGIAIHGLAHITGGGVVDNLPRILPEGTGAMIEHGTWQIPAIFDLIQELGGVNDEEMFHVFNMGLGMLVVVSADDASRVLTTLPEASIVGEIVAGDGTVKVVKA